MDYQARLPTPFAVIGIHCDADAITGIEFLPPDTPALHPENDFARLVCEAILDYLEHANPLPPVPMKPAGTPFQQRVWSAISQIPPGQTWTYTNLAKQVSSGARAVANACGANPIPLFVPCHRVVAVNGIGGFMQGRNPSSLNIKHWLLAHERGKSQSA